MSREVSVVIATYNMKAFVKEAIESSLTSLVDPEVIVVDDGSTDGTYEYLKKCFGSNGNIVIERFDYNKGKVAAFNKGVSLASGLTVTLLGADDWMLPGRSLLVEVVLGEPDVDLAVGDYHEADADMKIMRHCLVEQACWPGILRHNKYPGGAMVFSNVLAKRVFPIKENINNEDYIIALVATFSGVSKAIKADVLIYRKHSCGTWSGMGEALIIKKGAERHIKVLDYFKNSFGPFDDVDTERISFAVKVNSLTANHSFLGACLALPRMLNSGYSFAACLRVLFGPNLYCKIKRFFKRNFECPPPAAKR